MHKTLGQKINIDLPALLGAGLGVVLFLLIYGPSTLNVTYDSWIFGGYIGVDILQHYAGWVAFREGSWALPLTFTTLLNYPLGGPAALADCIPLFALPAKLFSGLLPETFQYFGWFSLFCMAMGGWAGARLLGQFPVGSGVRVAGSVLFAASPILLERAFQHTALAAHFLVVMALTAYFRARRSGFARWPWGFAVLSTLAVFTHVYLVPMVLAIAFAAAVDALAVKRGSARHWGPAAVLGASIGAALLSGLLLGYFGSADYLPGGYGSFGLNLNAFWNPSSFNWAMWDPNYQNLDWSRVLPQLPVVGDSLGSFAYLGGGVLAALAACGVVYAVRLLRASGIKGAVKTGGRFAAGHAGLLFSCLCLTVFAVSNVVTANSRTLFTLPLPQWLVRAADTFRSSGRLIWPVYYLLVLLAILGCSFLLKRRQPTGVAVAGGPSRRGQAAAVLLLAVLLLVQGFDLSGVLAEKHAYFAGAVVPQNYAPPENWNRIERRGRILYQLELNEDRPTALRAALAGMPSNYFLLARGSAAALQADMARARALLEAGQLPHADAAYLTADDALAAELRLALYGVCESFSFERYTVFVPLA